MERFNLKRHAMNIVEVEDNFLKISLNLKPAAHESNLLSYMSRVAASYNNNIII